MTLIVLSEERVVLSDLHALDERVFNFLAEQMDWGSGEIGVKSSVSLGYISGALSEDIPTKAKGLLVDVKPAQVRMSIDRMVNAGLFIRLSVNKRLMLRRLFWVKMLSVVKSVENQDRTKIAQKDAQEIKKIAYIFNGLYRNIESRSHNKNIKDRTYLNTNYLSNSADVEFSMTYQWRPDPEKLKESLALSAMRPEQIHIDWTAEHIRYFSSVPDMKKTAAGWLDHYVSKMVVYIRDPMKFAELNGYISKPVVGVGSASVSKKIKSLIPPVPKRDDELDAYAQKWGFTYPCPQHLKTHHEYREKLNLDRIAFMDKNERSNNEGQSNAN